jgi:hypothetical protein
MRITTRIKQLIYPLYIYWRITKKEKLQNLDAVALHNLKLFSNRNEDGIVLQLVNALKIEDGFFVDIGSNDCINSNCANLVFNLNWSGVFIDADEKLLQIGKRNYTFFNKKEKVKFVQSFVTKENINVLVKENIGNREIDFVSIDIDGNDYEIWKAFDLNPKLVVVENKIEYGGYDIVVPVSNNFSADEWGASIHSFTKLSEAKGYTLVASNNAGFNAFYVRNDLIQKYQLQPLLLQSVLGNSAINTDFYDAKKMDALLNRI